MGPVGLDPRGGLTLDSFAPGGPFWPGYDLVLEEAPQFNLNAELGLIGGKRVVINDYLPPGVLYSTANEIILSKAGWESLIVVMRRKQECRAAVKVIVERRMGDVLTWLREAGHRV